MILTWHGEGAVKITEKESTVIINPHAGGEIKMPKISADIALIAPGVGTEEGLKDAGFVINHPGEYEVKGVFVYGIDAQGAQGQTMVAMVEAEGISVGYLGGLSQDQLTSQQLEVLEGVDVVFVPVGGEGSLTPKQAIKCINQIEPRIIIPIDYATSAKGKKLGVDAFLREYGVEKKHEVVDKLKITKKDLPQEDSRVIVLERI